MIIYLISIILIGIAIGAIILCFETSVDWILDKAFDNNPDLVTGIFIVIFLCLVLSKFKIIYKFYKKSEENKKQIHDEIKLLLICILIVIIIVFILSTIVSFIG